MSAKEVDMGDCLLQTIDRHVPISIEACRFSYAHGARTQIPTP